MILLGTMTISTEKTAQALKVYNGMGIFEQKSDR